VTVKNLMTSLFTKLPQSPPGKILWPWVVEPCPLTIPPPVDCPWPKISIVTPSYNQGDFLEMTIRSVLLQGYPNLEYIIIDGSSTDISLEIIKKYEKHISFWCSEEDEGQSDAINKGVERSTGDLIGWINSDDFLQPHALFRVAEMYVKDPSAGVYVGGGQFVDKFGKLILLKEPASDLSLSSLLTWLDDFHFMQPSCFFSRKAWVECGPLDLGLHCSMDLDLWLKFAKKYKFLSTTENLSCSRVHEAAKTLEFANMSIVDSCIVLMQHGGKKEARKHLEMMAAKLSWNEYYMGKILAFPVVKLFRGTIRRLMNSEQKWREVSPPWTKNE
jgi:glycosyltransferase involved in cell wall biosynthesis